MIQSLKTIDDLDGFFRGYGLVVVDECHHLPAFSFEACVRRAPVRHLLGLTATPYRRDGLQEIITMQCGPIRHQITTAEGPRPRLSLQLEVRETAFSIARTCRDADPGRVPAARRETRAHGARLRRRRRSAPTKADAASYSANGRSTASCSPTGSAPRASPRSSLDGSLGKRAHARRSSSRSRTQRPAAARRRRDRPVPRRRLRLPAARHPLPRLPRLVQRPPRPVHRTPHAHQPRQDRPSASTTTQTPVYPCSARCTTVASTTYKTLGFTREQAPAEASVSPGLEGGAVVGHMASGLG